MTESVERPSPLFPVPPRVVDLPDNVPVQYIGSKPEYLDRLYGTKLTFSAGQIRTIPKELARKFLRHGDMFRFAGDAPVVERKPEPEPADDTEALLKEAETARDVEEDTESRVRDVYDQVNYQMDKDALELFARVNYRQDLDKRKKVETLRKEVIGLIDQYGAPA